MMELSEMRKARDILEDELGQFISQKVRAFQNLTGLAVDGVSTHCERQNSIGPTRHLGTAFVHVDVSVTI